MRDWEQVVKDVYDPVQKALRVKRGLGDLDAGDKRDWGQAWKRIYDSVNNCLRVDLIGAPSGSTVGDRDAKQAFKQSVNVTTSKLKLVS